MIVVYTADRAERLAAQYEKMPWFTVQRILIRVPTHSRAVDGVFLNRGPYARVYKKGKLQLTIQQEWISEGSVLL